MHSVTILDVTALHRTVFGYSRRQKYFPERNSCSGFQNYLGNKQSTMSSDSLQSNRLTSSLNSQIKKMYLANQDNEFTGQQEHEYDGATSACPYNSSNRPGNCNHKVNERRNSKKVFH